MAMATSLKNPSMRQTLDDLRNLIYSPPIPKGKGLGIPV
jgi:hypothetical protein